jgi:hypothetical protein
MTRSRKIITLLAVSTGLYAVFVRPRLLRWGATDEEVREPYPGVDLIPAGERGATMAITIDAPPSQVWPWLVQMGCDRAGWYSWDRLDNGGVPSAETIHPEWQQLRLGDRMASTPSGNAWFEVAALDPPHFLGLRASINLLDGRPFDTTRARPGCYIDGLWGFKLKELAGDRTRLVVSGYGSARPRLLQKVAEFFFWEPAHWIMQTRQFANLCLRVESKTPPADRESSG